MFNCTQNVFGYLVKARRLPVKDAVYFFLQLSTWALQAANA